MTNDGAVKKYHHNIRTARELIAMLNTALDEATLIADEDVNYGHVGDIGHVNELLRELVSFVDEENENVPF